MEKGGLEEEASEITTMPKPHHNTYQLLQKTKMQRERKQCTHQVVVLENRADPIRRYDPCVIKGVEIFKPKPTMKVGFFFFFF